mmetsp:Transcript_10348/g.32033  ORF Transcript_10348/g.32033 Transcript_10348/m.32033 type:complete len:207 (-) Transcript_10348:131-751(-)
MPAVPSSDAPGGAPVQEGRRAPGWTGTAATPCLGGSGTSAGALPSACCARAHGGRSWAGCTAAATAGTGWPSAARARCPRRTASGGPATRRARRGGPRGARCGTPRWRGAAVPARSSACVGTLRAGWQRPPRPGAGARRASPRQTSACTAGSAWLPPSARCAALPLWTSASRHRRRRSVRMRAASAPRGRCGSGSASSVLSSIHRR